MTTQSRYPSARRSMHFSALLCFAFLACGIPQKEQPPQPAVSSSTPAADATGVAVDTTVSVVFDRAMEPLVASNFDLRQGANPIAGEVTNSADGLTATFT